MSWFDLIIVLVIGGSALWGYKSGFFSSAFRIVSMVASIFIAYSIYPVVSNILKGSFINASIKNSVVKMLQGIMNGPEFQGAAKQAQGNAANQLVDRLSNSLPIPSGLKSTLAEKAANITPDQIPGASQTIEAAKNAAINSVSTVFTGLIIDVISIIVVIILVRVILFVIEKLLNGVFKLPVLKGINQSAGLILGFAEGVLIVFVAAALISLFNVGSLMNSLNDSLQHSLLGSIFYDHNFILRFLNK
jgi:uncharacterized membrane protein required for colicin V production